MSLKRRLDAIEKKLGEGRGGKGGYFTISDGGWVGASGRYEEQADGTWILFYTYATGEKITKAEYNKRYSEEVGRLQKLNPGKKFFPTFHIVIDDRPISMHEDE